MQIPNKYNNLTIEKKSTRALIIEEIAQRTGLKEVYVRNRINRNLYPCDTDDLKVFFFRLEKSDLDFAYAFNAFTKLTK